MLKNTTILLLALTAATYMIGPANAQLLIINEFVARNDSEPPLRNGELLDEDGDASDWIEIYNPSGEPGGIVKSRLHPFQTKRTIGRN